MFPIACPCAEGEPHDASIEIHIRPEFLDVGGHALKNRPEDSWIRILACENIYLRTLAALAEAAEYITTHENLW